MFSFLILFKTKQNKTNWKFLILNGRFLFVCPMFWYLDKSLSELTDNKSILQVVVMTSIHSGFSLNLKSGMFK